MQTEIDLVFHSKVVQEIFARLEKRETISLSNVNQGLKGFLTCLFFEKLQKPVMVISGSETLNRSSFFTHNKTKFSEECFVYPEESFHGYFAEEKSQELTQMRLVVLERFVNHQLCIVLTSIAALMQKIPTAETFCNEILEVKPQDRIDTLKLAERLTDLGYVRVSQVESKGQFSLRGEILDVFASTEEWPWRIDFFDDEIETIKTFDLNSQRSLNLVDEIRLFPASDHLFNDQERTGATLADYIEDGLIIFDEPERIKAEAEHFVEKILVELKNLEIEGTLKNDGFMDFLTYDEVMKSLASFSQIRWSSFADQGLDSVSINLHAKNLESFKPAGVAKGDFSLFNQYLTKHLNDCRQIIIGCRSDKSIENTRFFLEEQGFLSAMNGTQSLINFVPYELDEGFEWSDANLVWLNEQDIFDRTELQKRKKRFKGKKIDHFSQLALGEYVVHDVHGIGIYRGVEQVKISGVRRDMVIIEYAEGDRFYLPVEQMDTVQAYIGSGSDHKPTIHHLGSPVWNRSKSKAKRAIEDMADELIELYAKRQQAKGFAFGPDTVWQNEFESAFPFSETDDQLRSIEEIKQDMEKPLPMDRLLCGDVGYGKTEVALRAAFKAIMDGKQVAMLVPTTILAQQHYHTIVERFDHFPVTVDLICRFKTTQQQEKILDEISKGQTDLLIGTHRLLSQDIHFKDLGLLIIDEEQRFGVKAKEKLKSMKHNVDVLTLSATPIPRTLHMSLSGIRDMSVIAEPPYGRKPVQTFVMRYSPIIISDAIHRELARGGQVYYLHNRVYDIEEVAASVAQMVPNARISIAHGQMTGSQLEKIMSDFLNHQYDVLVTTTIIESGLDITNANTIIVNQGDHYGLSQLYQLRGRVGRSDRQAYCYITYKKESLNETAQKRLQAIKDFTAFGSGFKIAMKDLEIRGAGNLLGAEQSGHLTNIGYEMYCRLLEEAIQSKLTGRPVAKVDTSVKIFLDADAYVPESYINDGIQKYEIYKKIAEVHSAEDIRNLTAELDDRFGSVPQSVQHLLIIARIKYLSALAGMKEIRQKKDQVFFYFESPERMPLPEPKIIYQLYDRFGLRLKGQSQSDLVWRIQLRSHETDHQLEEIHAFLEML